jgi:hypothetical protein
MLHCLLPPREVSQETLLYHLDAMLLWLGGVFDVTALIADQAYGMGTSAWLIGWKRKEWRKGLQVAAPSLHNLTETGMPVRAVIDLVAAFRNTIHGEPVGGVTYSSSGNTRHLIQLPEDAEAEADRACAVLGGSGTWGLVQKALEPLGGLWDPYIVVQMLIPFAAAALNAIMQATEVERLPGVTADSLTTSRPTDGFFEPDRVHRLLLLHGFPP